MAVPKGPPVAHRHLDTERRIAQLPPRLRWATGALRLTLREPADGLDRVRVRAQAFLNRGRPTGRGHPYTVAMDWHRRLHEQLGAPWPCAWTSDFEHLWTQVAEEVRKAGVLLGRGTYGGWDDADPALAHAIWCLVHAEAPEKVVETGVAHGVTTRIILEALHRNGAGHLWSIDLPAMDPTLHGEIGVAVPGRLCDRWTYIRGTSRRRLPGLLSQIAPIDLFVHDSSHTERNMSFELAQAWPALRRGAAVADDVHQSPAFASFTRAVCPADAYVAPADDGTALFGIALKDA